MKDFVEFGALAARYFEKGIVSVRWYTIAFFVQVFAHKYRFKNLVNIESSSAREEFEVLLSQSGRPYMNKGVQYVSKVDRTSSSGRFESGRLANNCPIRDRACTICP